MTKLDRSGEADPLCIHCRERPVRRMYGRSSPGRRGLRIIEGVRWGWFCSPSCASIVRAGNFPKGHMRMVAHANILKAERRAMARLVAACKDVMDDHGKVDPKDLVKAVLLELRLQYQRQYQRGRKARAA